jgi:hypothetical protein
MGGTKRAVRTAHIGEARPRQRGNIYPFKSGNKAETHIEEGMGIEGIPFCSVPQAVGADIMGKFSFCVFGLAATDAVKDHYRGTIKRTFHSGLLNHKFYF